MSEYIDREALTNALDAVCERTCLYSKPNRAVMCGACPLGHAFDTVEEFPAADVRPVVLCRDCIHFQQFRAHDGFCQIDGMLWNNDFFCANGKREES